MSTGQNNPGTPPITKPSAAVAGGAPAQSAGVSRTALIWIGVAVVLLSFVAAFLGSWLARSTEAAAEPTPTPTASPTYDPADYAEAIESILPAGAAVRVGTGVPAEGKGYEGELYINVLTSDVYVFRDGAWVQVGNIEESAAANLTGATGATGESGAAGATGATGATGETGAAGAPGTQVALGVEAPDAATCTANGDIFIDTVAWAFYQCEDGAWTPFGPPPADAGEQTTPDPDPSETPEG